MAERQRSLDAMTTAPHVPRLAFRDLNDAIAALRARGLRVSTARRLLLEALFAAEGPVAAELLASRLSIDAASVYRNLETLEHHGLVAHVHLGHGPGLYVLTGQGEHEYLYCDRCGTVRSVRPEQLDPIRHQLRDLFGYETRFAHFPIVGLCPRCAAREPADAAATTRARRPHAHPHPDSHGDLVHAHGRVRP